MIYITIALRRAPDDQTPQVTWRMRLPQDSRQLLLQRSPSVRGSRKPNARPIIEPPDGCVRVVNHELNNFQKLLKASVRQIKVLVRISTCRTIAV